MGMGKIAGFVAAGMLAAGLSVASVAPAHAACAAYGESRASFTSLENTTGALKCSAVQVRMYRYKNAQVHLVLGPESPKYSSAASTYGTNTGNWARFKTNVWSAWYVTY